MGRRWGRAGDASSSDCSRASALVDSSQQQVACQPAAVKCDHVQKISPKTEVKQKCTFYESGYTQEVVVSTTDQILQPELHSNVLDYRQSLRALWLRDRGCTKSDVAKELTRPVGWVTSCWQGGIEKVHTPKGVATYIAAHETKMLRAGIEPFRKPSLKRSFVEDSAGLYEEMAANFEWEQSVLRKRNYETGGVTITKIASSRQDCTFPTLQTGIYRLDQALLRAREEFDIKDPGAYLTCNWYPDGNTNIAPHQHDFWSVTFSFGASRIFLLDSQPLLLSDGDLLVFGTQKHSVPKMPLVKNGRISVSIFFYPERTKADGSFIISLDPSLLDAATSNEDLANMVAQAAANSVSKQQLGTGGRGVGRHEDEDEGSETSGGLMSEDRLMAIAMELSMLEQ